MAFHFSLDELASRQRTSIKRLEERDIDSRSLLFSHAPDLTQAQSINLIEDIRFSVDGHGMNPTEQLRNAVTDLDCSGKGARFEYSAFGLNEKGGDLLNAPLQGFCDLVDASNLVARQRAANNPSELIYMRTASAVADTALVTANRMAAPGICYSDIPYTIHGAISSGNKFIIGSDISALLCRFFTGQPTPGMQGQLKLKFDPAYHQYRACLMRKIIVIRLPWPSAISIQLARRSWTLVRTPFAPASRLARYPTIMRGRRMSAAIPSAPSLRRSGWASK